MKMHFIQVKSSIVIRKVLLAFLLIPFTGFCQEEVQEDIILEDVDMEEPDEALISNWFRDKDVRLAEIKEKTGLEIFKIGGLFGLRKHGEVALEPVYSEIVLLDLEYDDHFKVYKNGLTGLLNNQGTVVLNCEYTDIQSEQTLNGKELRIAKDSLRMVGVVDHYGDVIIPFEYDDISTVKNAFELTKNGLKGLAKSNGEVTVEPCSEYVSHLADTDFLLLRKEELYGMYEDDGTEVFPISMKNFWFLMDGNRKRLFDNVVIMKSDSSFALKSVQTGELVIPFQKLGIIQHHNNYFVTNDGQDNYGLMQGNKEILPAEYSRIAFEYPGLSNSVIVELDEKSALVNLDSEKLLMDFKYSQVQSVHKGYYKVQEEDKFKLVNSLGEQVCPYQFNEIGCFYNNEALVWTDQDVSLLDFNCSLKYVSDSLKPHKGYTHIHDIQQEFVSSMNLESNDSLKIFSKKMVPSEHIFNTLERLDRSYRYYMDSRDWMVQPNEQNVDKFFQEMEKLKEEYKQHKSLYPNGKIYLFFAEDENIHSDGELRVAKLMANFYSEDEFGEFIPESYLVITLGEVFFVDGFWTVFTKPFIGQEW